MFEKTSEFIENAFPGDLEPFYDPRELTDCKVGFSIKRKYPESIRFKPAKTSTGEHDSVAAIWVVYAHNKSDRDVNVPVTFRVETLSIYRSKYFDVDFDDPAAPTQNSLEQSNASPQPIGVEFNDDYYFDHENNIFKDKKGRELGGKEILEKVFEIHCNTIHFFKGIKIQAKLLWQSKFVGVLSIIISSFEFLLKKYLEEHLRILILYRHFIKVMNIQTSKNSTRTV